MGGEAMSKKQEISLRRKTLIWLAKQGKTREQAADALGVSLKTVSCDIKAMGVNYPAVKRIAKSTDRSILLKMAVELSELEWAA